LTRSLLILVIAALSGAVHAAPPTLKHFVPTGGQVGTEFTITAAGDLPQWPVQAWCDRADVKIVAENDKGKLRVSVANDAPPGMAWVRLFNGEGTSAARPLILDQLPHVVEAEPNDEPDKPQTITAGVNITGKLAKRGDVDAFSIVLKQGDTLVASLRAHNVLGSAMDAVLQICEVRERKTSSVANSPPRIEAFVLAQNNDARGLDPQLAHVAPRDGTYLVRVFTFPSEPDSGINFAGNDDFLYHLTITTGGLVEGALPIAGSPGKWVAIGLGLPVEGVAATTHERTVFVPGVAGFAQLSALQMIAEQDAASSASLHIAGRLAASGEADTFKFTATKDRIVAIELDARSRGWPLDGVLTISDAAGKTLQTVDDADKERDPKLNFKPPADGEYAVRVSDLHDRGGPRFCYELHIDGEPTRATLTVKEDQFKLAAGASVEIPITIARGARTPELTITALDLPAGVTAAPVTSPRDGDASKAVKLILTATADASPGGYPIRLRADHAGDPPLSIFATAGPAPRMSEPLTHIWLTIVKP
jgi:hypothetical protein